MILAVLKHMMLQHTAESNAHDTHHSKPSKERSSTGMYTPHTPSRNNAAAAIRRSMLVTGMLLSWPPPVVSTCKSHELSSCRGSQQSAHRVACQQVATGVNTVG